MTERPPCIDRERCRFFDDFGKSGHLDLALVGYHKIADDTTEEAAKRPYEKPAIVEEEAYETCVLLACGFKTGRTCRHHVNRS